MPQSTVILLISLAMVSIALAWFHYFFKAKNPARYTRLLFFLRAAGIFSVLLLLINPTFIHNEYYSEKPNLLLAVDNSTSIKSFGDSAKVVEFVNHFREHPEIQEKFNLNIFTFGSELRRDDSLNFNENQTNIQRSLNDLDKIYNNSTAPTILITDGNQTFGGNYQFEAQNYGQSLFPVVVGDTTNYQDLFISRINTNSYAFLNNDFPVELFLNYTGNSPVQSKLEITKGNSVIYSTKVNFDENTDSQVVEILLPANTLGISNYQVAILPLTGEKNPSNNVRNFVVEVIDVRTSVLMVSSVTHPDLGVLKRAVEANQQREVKIVMIEDLPEERGDFELLILYQPSSKFDKLWEILKNENKNYLVVAGPQTDWRFLNQVQSDFKKELTGQTEEYFPELNEEFQAFQLEDIGYSGFPPLNGSFGEVTIQTEMDVLLYQKVRGISTNNPLLAFVKGPDSKKIYLFGSGLWKWRSEVFANEASFEPFDEMIGNLIQVLASNAKRERIRVDHEKIYYGNETIRISSQYFDENFNFDSRRSLNLELTNLNTQEKQLYPMTLAGNEYQVKLGRLPPSDYALRITVEGTNVSEGGTFTLLDFEVENQFTQSDLSGLQRIADSRHGELFYPEDSRKLIKELLSDNNSATVQKSRQKHVSLIDWYYLLGISILLFSTEWFLRKYHGLI